MMMDGGLIFPGTTGNPNPYCQSSLRNKNSVEGIFFVTGIGNEVSFFVDRGVAVKNEEHFKSFET